MGQPLITCGEAGEMAIAGEKLSGVLLRLLFVALMLLVVRAMLPKPTPPFSQPIEVKLSVSDRPLLGKPVELAAEFAIGKNYRWDAPGTRAQITLPEGIELVAGALAWQGDIVRGKAYHLRATVKALRTGLWTIEAKAFYCLNQTDCRGGSGYLYVLVSEKGAKVSRKLADVAPRTAIYGGERVDPSEIPNLYPQRSQ